jgi:hypothetical protein
VAATPGKGRTSVPGAPRTPGFSAGRARPGCTLAPWRLPQLRLYSAPLAATMPSGGAATDGPDAPAAGGGAAA